MKTILLIGMLLLGNNGWSAVKPADGFWRTTDDPDIGSGLMLNTQGDTTLASLFTYTLTGQPKWYLGVGQVDDNGLYRVELLETTHGTDILAENPASALVAADTRALEVQFNGSQIATFTIDGGLSKSIQPYHFAQPAWQTEHQTLTDGSPYVVPDLAGTWVLGSAASEESVIMQLTELDAVSNPAAPFLEKTYQSNHPSSQDWLVSCPWQFIPTTLPFSQPFCVVDRQADDLADLKIPFAQLGYDTVQLVGQDEQAVFSGHRVDASDVMQPSDGYWRTQDDPAIGGGLVLTTQNGVTVVLMYTYDEQGEASWKIASGAFDDEGLMVAALFSTTGGSPIEIDGKTSATFAGQAATLSIQLIGTELATLSVDGSTPKIIQSFNFGVHLYETDNLLINGQPFIFKDLSADWVFVENDTDSLRSGVINIQNYSGSISPPPPGSPPAYFGSTSDSDDVYLSFFLVCPRIKERFEADSCVGTIRTGSEEERLKTKINFEDIGFTSFKLYVESPAENGEYDQYGTFYRIPTD